MVKWLTFDLQEFRMYEALKYNVMQKNECMNPQADQRSRKSDKNT